MKNVSSFLICYPKNKAFMPSQRNWIVPLLLYHEKYETDAYATKHPIMTALTVRTVINVVFVAAQYVTVIADVATDVKSIVLIMYRLCANR